MELYRGGIKARSKETYLFMLDSSDISKIYLQIISEYAPSITHINFSLPEQKYHFCIRYYASSNYPFLKFLEKLKKVFPQIIWMKILETEKGIYKLEFIPVAIHLKRKDENGNLADCLEEMGYNSKNLITTFKKKFEEVFYFFEEKSNYRISLYGDSIELNADKDSSKNYFKESEESEQDNILLRLSSLQSQIQKKQQQENNKFEGKVVSVDRTGNKYRKYPRKRPKFKLRNWLMIGSIISLILITLLCLSHFYSLGIIEGNSMKPTLSNRSIVLLKKVHQLKRNDIIIFNVPQMANKEFVKRIVALPGDSIYATQGNLYVNGSQVKNQYDSQFTSDFNLKATCGRKTVPAHKFFVLGDNREHSTDSRNFGFVDESEIKGKALNDINF